MKTARLGGNRSAVEARKNKNTYNKCESVAENYF